MAPHYDSRHDVCLDIDSDEQLKQDNMFADPHRRSKYSVEAAVRGGGERKFVCTTWN